MKSKTERLFVIIIVSVHVCLALGHAATPVFESQEELQHTLFVRFIKHYQTLPGPDLPFAGYQSIQAPLYYVLAAVITAPIDETDFENVTSARNPYYGADIGGIGSDNKNLRLHDRSQQFPFPASPTVQSVYLMRLLSVALNTATLILSYLIYRILWPDRPHLHLAALGIAGFWPAALYYLTLAGNDVMVAFAGTLVLWLTLRQHQRGPTWQRAVGLGAALGIAMLSKGNAIFLALPLGAATIFDRRFWKFAPISVGLMILIAGWWYARNLVVYGELTGISLVFQHAPQQRLAPGEQSFGQWLWRMGHTYDTLWALFGIEIVPVADWMYRVFDVLTVLGFVGLAARGVRFVRQAAVDAAQRPALLQAGVVGLFALSWVAGIGYLMTVVGGQGSHGRHFMPGVTAWAAMLALGLDFWIPTLFKTRAALSFAAVYAMLSTLALTAFLLPAYQPLPAPANIEHPLNYSYENTAILTGIDPPELRLRPGQSSYLTLHWQAIRPADASLIVSLHSLDYNLFSGGVVVRRDSYPGTGNLLSTEWLPRQAWSERYRITIPADAVPQFVHLLTVNLYDPQADRALAVSGPSGPLKLPVVGRVVVGGPIQPFEPDFRFGGAIGLNRPEVTRANHQITVCLRWVALRQVDVDYTAFVHFTASDGTLLAQSDVQAGGANYPSSVWLVGESTLNCTTLAETALPPSGWQVTVGLYNLATGQRLPVIDRTGAELDSSSVTIKP